MSKTSQAWSYEGERGRYANIQWHTYKVLTLGKLNEIAQDLVGRLGQLPVHISMQYALSRAPEDWMDGGHTMTDLNRHDFENIRIEGIADICRLLEAFLIDRECLREMYNDSNSPLCEEFGHESGSEYYDVTGLRFRVYKPTFVTTIGDRQSHLMTHVLEQNDGEPGE